MNRDDVLKKSESALVAKKIYVEKMNFYRKKVLSGKVRLTESSIGKNVEKTADNEYKCSLAFKMSDDSEATVLEIVVSGLFEFNADLTDGQKEVIITKNTMAILFPYLRAQVTLMTSQPDVDPVVLPAININALLQNLEENLP